MTSLAHDPAVLAWTELAPDPDQQAADHILTAAVETAVGLIRDGQNIAARVWLGVGENAARMVLERGRP